MHNRRSDPICDFEYTGVRVPLIVISPFTRKNYVSHTIADYTAILKFIETRYNLPSLTARDAAQMDMIEFFDFASAPWSNPPDPPEQPTNRPCAPWPERHLPQRPAIARLRVPQVEFSFLIYG